jgi:hypothetical protein
MFSMRLVTPDDATYILSLRQDDRKNQHLSTTTGTVAQQRVWIEAYQHREAANQELYFILLNDDTPCGTVRLYDYKTLSNGERSFCWGSWIVADGAPSSTALRSALAVYQLAFTPVCNGGLGFDQSHFDVRLANLRVLAFHQRLGATITHQDQQDAYFTYDRSTYEAIRPRYQRYLLTSLVSLLQG